MLTASRDRVINPVTRPNAQMLLLDIQFTARKLISEHCEQCCCPTPLIMVRNQGECPNKSVPGDVTNNFKQT